MTAGDRIILLAEDEADDAALIQRALKKGNILNEIVLVRDGVEALEYLFGVGAFEKKENPVLPAVLLLDLKMPRMGGFEVLKAIREDPRTKSLPVVILTSSTEPSDLEFGYKLGANSYVQKPVDFNKFAMAVQQLGLYWMVLNQPPPRPSGA